VATELRVVATAGHVDHGKSSLIVRLTGIDPDRWAEEKRRGLTIDLGYAWTTLPSGREVGFVDVPGHERFIANMLAGVGPVRLVLFVVAADEGWKPQSEEHLQILDVLGVSGAVIALTKRDLVDDETLAIATHEVREQVEGTALEGAPIVPASAATGDGVEDLVVALDAMVARAATPPAARTRLYVDRVFTIKGAGTIVTGTLEGGSIVVDDEVSLQPGAETGRVRGLQTHKRSETRADPVSRVAANLVGADRARIQRGDVVVEPGAWEATTIFDATLRPVHGSDAIPAKGAFKVHAGAAEADARLRLADAPGGGTFARISVSRPLVVQPGDRFVLREAGRRATVGGGVVLDATPPYGGWGGERTQALVARRHALGLGGGEAGGGSGSGGSGGGEADGGAPDPLAAIARLHVEERGASRSAVVRRAVGAAPPADLDVGGGWSVAAALRAAATDALLAMLTAHHRDHPLDDGASLDEARATITSVLRDGAAPTHGSLVDALLETAGVVRTATVVRLPSHTVAWDERTADLDALLAAIGGEHLSTPPTVKDLVAAGHAADLIEAASRAGALTRLTTDLVVAPAFVDRALAFIRDNADRGVTVSQLRAELATSRKYAVPLVEWLDAHGHTRRRGDLRFPRD